MNYWEKRMLDHGHTGWKDPAIYAFDQKIRLEVVKELLSKSNILDTILDHEGSLLDFGCGSGDFSAFLKDYYKNVYMFDVSEYIVEMAASRVKNSIPISSLDKLFDIQSSYDTILSVTVLQHIMDDEEMSLILQYFNKKLTREGVFLCIETFPKLGNSMQRNWNCHQFETLMEQNDFVIEEKYDFYYPPANELFLAYADTVYIKILSSLYGNIKFLRKMIINKMQKYASKYNENIYQFIKMGTNDFGTKVYVLRKKI